MARAEVVYFDHEGSDCKDRYHRRCAITKLECDGQCMGAYRNFCGCGCGGINHGKAWGTQLGQSEQLDSALDKWRTLDRQRQRTCL
jgi:hypothetical protein